MTPQERKVMELAFEALKENQHLVADNQPHAYVMEYNSIIEKCEQALAKTEQEPATKEQIREAMIFNLPLYTTPPQRTFVGLTDEDIERIKLLTFEKEINTDGEEQEAVNLDQLIRAAEQLCKEKNYE